MHALMFLHRPSVSWPKQNWNGMDEDERERNRSFLHNILMANFLPAYKININRNLCKCFPKCCAMRYEMK